MCVHPHRAADPVEARLRVQAKAWIDARSGGAGTRRVETLAKERVERDEEDLVRLYLTDIGQYPLLTKDDEVRLAQTIEGGRDAQVDQASRRSRTSRRPRGGS